MTDYKERQKEAAEIRSAARTAFNLIKDAKAQYVKVKFRTKGKRDAKNADELFAELEPYNDEFEINEAYGWDIISQHTRDRLLELWKLREIYKKNGKYSDMVTEMLDKAAGRLLDGYHDLLDEADAEARENNKNQKELWRF